MQNRERDIHIYEKICEINAKFQNENSFKVLKNYSPALMNKMVSSKAIVEMSPKNFIAFLTYLLDFKFVKILTGTPSHAYIENIILNNIDKLTPIQVTNLVMILRQSNISDEHLYIKISIHIMSHSADYSIRSVSNILSNFVKISRKSKSFVPFFEFMKKVIVNKLNQQSANEIDIRSILKSYSSTYNLSQNFMMILEQECIKLINKRACSVKSMAIMMHTFNLNKAIYNAGGLLTMASEVFENNLNRTTLIELILLLQVIQDQGQFTEYHMQVLGRKIIFFEQKMNLMDLKACHAMYLKYLIDNEESCFEKSPLSQDPKIYYLLPKYVPALNALLRVFNALHIQIDACDLVHYLTNINVVIDHNTKDGREFVRNLKMIIKLKYQKNEIKSGEEKNLIDLINQIKVEKIRKIFLNKFN